MNTNSELTERTATYYSKGKWRLWKQICKNIFHYYFWGGRRLILITFSLGKAREGTSAIASGQAKPVRPAPEQCRMPLLLTLAWLRSSVNTALPFPLLCAPSWFIYPLAQIFLSWPVLLGSFQHCKMFISIFPSLGMTPPLRGAFSCCACCPGGFPYFNHYSRRL